MGDTSSASRVCNLMKGAAGIEEGQSAIRVFPKLFGLGEVTPGNLQQDLVYDCLRDFRDEIRRVEQGLTKEERNISADAIKAAYNFTNITTLHESWNALRAKNLRAEVLTAWQYLALHFKDKSPEIPVEEFAALTDELNELEKAASAEGVPDDLRQFIGEQIDRVRRAMRRYKVIGAAALREAVRTIYGEAFCTLPNVDRKNPAAQAALGKFGKVLTKTATVARDIKSLHDFVGLMASHVPALAQLASNLPAPN